MLIIIGKMKEHISEKFSWKLFEITRSLKGFAKEIYVFRDFVSPNTVISEIAQDNAYYYWKNERTYR